MVSDMYIVGDREGWKPENGNRGLRWDRDRILSVLPFYPIYG